MVSIGQACLPRCWGCLPCRFGELEIEQRHLAGGYSSIRPGDCIVAFSRKDIFEIKAEIERTTDHKVGTLQCFHVKVQTLCYMHVSQGRCWQVTENLTP